MYEYDDLVGYVTNNIKKNRMVFIINGNGASGKDYLINHLQCHIKNIKIRNESVIDQVKLMAYCHDLWDGNKDEKGRRLLNDMKKAFDTYNDFTSKYIINIFNSFINSDDGDSILFIHCGNLKQINTLRDLFKLHCPVCRIFITSPNDEFRDDPRYDENNESDENKNSKNYDVCFYNSFTVSGSAQDINENFADLILALYKKEMGAD